MKDENGKVLTEKEIIKDILDGLADLCCPAFELQSPAGAALGWMIDNALKYGTVIYHADDPLLATCDYVAYEEKLCDKKRNALQIVT